MTTPTPRPAAPKAGKSVAEDLALTGLAHEAYGRALIEAAKAIAPAELVVVDGRQDPKAHAAATRTKGRKP